MARIVIATRQAVSLDRFRAIILRHVRKAGTYMGNFKDLTGQRFGHLVALTYLSGSRTKKGRWICKCDCGKMHEVATNNLTRGKVKSCGCDYRRPYDYSGQRFGKLLVVSPCTNDNGRQGWLCKCDCGNETFIETGRLTAALKYPDNHKYTVNSCGCALGGQPIHGGSRTRLYSVWVHMKRRCYDKNDVNFRHYGARGIKMCDKWRNDFSAFQAWALSNGFDESLKWSDCTIDRIDVNGNYEPNNCRWVDMHTQLLNRRAARLP